MSPERRDQGNRRGGDPGRSGSGRGSGGRGGDRGQRRGEADDGGRREKRGSTPRQPAGIDRARRTAGAPPRPSDRGARVRKPDLPEDATFDLPRGVVGEIKRHSRGREQRDVLVAVSMAAEALEEDDGSRALPYLQWAKEEAPRSPSIRESLGIAHYLVGDYAAALTELQTYRRLSARPDQNHLIADCLRALGRGTDRIPELVGEMDGESPADRHTEAVIVWGSHLADRGELAAGRAVIRRRVEALDDGDLDVEEHHLRLWYVAADLAERDGDTDAAVEYLERIVEQAEGFFDAEERLERLS